MKTAPWSGVLSTAGNVVFGSTMEGNSLCAGCRTGKDLWHFPGNEVSFANPISYLSNGKQQVAIAIGDVLMAFGWTSELTRLLHEPNSWTSGNSRWRGPPFLWIELPAHAPAPCLGHPWIGSSGAGHHGSHKTPAPRVFPDPPAPRCGGDAPICRLPEELRAASSSSILRFNQIDPARVTVMHDARGVLQGAGRWVRHLRIAEPADLGKTRGAGVCESRGGPRRSTRSGMAKTRSRSVVRGNLSQETAAAPS